jgi:flagella basal body P-ring formation protein FlgA
MTLPLLFMAACLPLAGDGDRILPADLAGAEPAFAALPGDAMLGFRPAPGVRRRFSVAELGRLARRYGLEIEPKSEICLERPLRLLSAADLMPVLRASLALPEARIEIVDYSRYSVPRGLLEFPRTALRAPPLQQPQATTVWRGFIRFGRTQRFAVWARVRVLVRTGRVVAAETLGAGKPIAAAQLRSETYEGFPPRVAPLISIDQAVGRAPRRPISAGAVLTESGLENPYEVGRGDTVRVQVSRGEARLEMQGRAEAAGRRGQMIPVRNPSSGKRFPARVEGAGRVVVSSR